MMTGQSPLLLFAAVIVLLGCEIPTAWSFQLSHRQHHSMAPRQNSVLFGGGGMGMAAAATKSKKGKKNGQKKKAFGNSTKGGADNKSVSSSFDVKAATARLEKRYDDFMLKQAQQQQRQEQEDKEDPRWASEKSPEDKAADDVIYREYVIAARVVAGSTAGGDALQDWVPIAQLCSRRPSVEYEQSAEIARLAISSICREVSHVAFLSAPVFASVPRTDVQYSLEPTDSFQKHVYDAIVEGEAEKSMTQSEAQSVLELSATTSLEDRSTIKQAYRKLSFSLHPDRFEGTPAECEEAAKRFSQVQLAYETLNSGVRDGKSSWYESLGGKDRTEFLGPIDLLPLASARDQLDQRHCSVAIIGMDPELTQSFVVRNLRSE